MAKHSEQVHAPIGGRLFTPMFFALGILVLVAGYFLFNRFVFGLGSAPGERTSAFGGGGSSFLASTGVFSNSPSPLQSVSHTS